MVRYGDVALIASMIQDDLLATSLRQIFLSPFSSGRDGGASLRHTLRAYFAAERNVSSAAAALGVTRQTVSNRLRVIEETLGRPLGVWATEIEAALQMEELAPDTYTGRIGSS
jgi:DNA-binding PucR family transcriptional regulator